MSYVSEIWMLVGIVFVACFVLVAFFTPRIDYRITASPQLDSDEFLHVIQATCQAAVVPGNRVEILTNGSRFYPAMLEAIRAAQVSVNFEAYIVEPGEIAERFIDALVERAGAGVETRVVLDSIGSSRMGGAPVRRLRRAGCHVYFYQSVSLYRLHRLNNRTHRELLVVDGAIAFTGGAGVADWWAKAGRRGPGWRDTMIRLEGPLVTSLQGVFAENWRGRRSADHAGREPPPRHIRKRGGHGAWFRRSPQGNASGYRDRDRRADHRPGAWHPAGERDPRTPGRRPRAWSWTASTRPSSAERARSV